MKLRSKVGPTAEYLPERLPNGRIIYRCLSGHFHNEPGQAWAC